MKITFLGGARTVTGSSFHLETAGGSLLVDCGLFQGPRSLEERNRKISLHHPKRIRAVVLTHAHIDHSGLLPALVKAGFRGPVLATPATRDLCEIMLLDSAHIQEMEAEWQSRKNLRRGGRPLEPLYTQEHARRALELFHPIPYGERQEVIPGVHVRFQDAGHILGSSSVEMWVTEDGETTKLVFSGDVGRKHQAIIRDPQPIEDAEILLVESTYGERLHKSSEETLQEFQAILEQAAREGQKVIIPAFAVGRTQEILYTLHALHRQGRLPDLPVYVDSPLAIAATEIFTSHPECFDGQARALLRGGDPPLSLPRLVFSRTAEESRAINTLKGAAVIISASGMCNAGRIKHHLKHHLWRPGSHILFIGFQAQGTTGRQIIEGAKRVKIFREWVAVRAHVHTLGGFSAHADQEELLEWVGHFRNLDLKIFVVHGEEASSMALAQALRDRGFSRVAVPYLLETVDLRKPPRESPTLGIGPAPEGAPAGRPLQELVDLERRLRRFRKRLVRKATIPEEILRQVWQKEDEARRILEEMESLLEG